MGKKAVILVNVGTPDKAEVRQVRQYLSEFLNDRRVIDLPWLLQKMLVNLIIVPFRAPKSTKLYRRLWTEKGSPLLLHLNDLTAKLQQRSGPETDFFGAMRYGNPSLRKVLDEVLEKNYEQLVLLPLYPQHASSTTGSVVEAAVKQIDSRQAMPSLHIISQFYDHPAFVDAFAKRINAYQPETFDHILFSYHGLPDRQINKIHPEVRIENCRCETAMPAHGRLCYRAQCYATTRLLVAKLGLPPEKCSTAFQSRLSKNWMTPFIDETIAKLAEKGIRKLLVVAPSFVADCLETTVEIGFEYNELFEKSGGEKLQLVESLNSEDFWVEAVIEMLGEGGSPEASELGRGG
ncbi:MAG: ferrochelatase [Bacteroidales bacterium]